MKLKERLANYRRTIEVSRKPDKDEFLNAFKITGVGIILIGAIGLVIFLLYYLTLGGFI